jgi:hypothetical protein
MFEVFSAVGPVPSLISLIDADGGSWVRSRLSSSRNFSNFDDGSQPKADTTIQFFL